MPKTVLLRSSAPRQAPEAGLEAGIVLTFPESVRFGQKAPVGLTLISRLEAENAELRERVVELALQIQELNEMRR